MRTKARARLSEPPLPTAAEIDILAALWRLGPSTVREVHEALEKGRSYTTTLTQMRLMAEKGLLTRNERFRDHLYEPAAPREQMQRRIAGALMHRAFGGSAKELVVGALGASPVSAEEIAEIRRMLSDLDNRKRGAK